MTKQILKFQFHGTKFRVIQSNNKAAWFIRTDIDQIFYPQILPMLFVQKDERDLVQLPESAKEETQIISESALYVLLFKLDSELSQEFRKFVTAEVLPVIRSAFPADQEGGAQ